MKDIERRLLAVQRSLMFAEAEVGDFIVIHSELDPRRAVPKFRKCGTILKKNETMLYIKPDGSDELFSIKKNDSKAPSFDLPRFHRHDKTDQSTHIIKTSKVTYIITVLATGVVIVRDNMHKIILELHSLTALPIGTHAILFQLAEKIYISISDKIQIFKTPITDVSVNDGIVSYKTSDNSEWCTNSVVLYDSKDGDITEDIQRSMYKLIKKLVPYRS